jgi:type I restriction-modification system DNA methylase subunit/restriction endonuclease S subunit
MRNIIEHVAKEAVKELVVSSTTSEITKETLPSFFEDLHNLLWNKAGLNPERALEHMTFFFAYRLIEQQADTLGLPQECRWSYIASLKNENDLFEAIKKGVTWFRQPGRTTRPFFKPHEIQKADLVHEIVQQINRISLTILRETDTLGDIFEYMLGRGMSTMSDEGQYFTNRAICKLAFKLAYDIKKTLRRADGSLCTFADWFCGTGGFPAEYVKGVKANLKDVDWKKDSGSVYCQDMNLSSVTTTLLNLLILTGIPFSGDKIRGSNSFSEPITTGTGAPFAGLTVDYSFMNPPYGGDKNKGKEYKFAYSKEVKGEDGVKTKKYFVNKEIQHIGIEDDDKVSAGVQLAMATLSTDGGVCSIVLLQGFFFGASKKCVELRKKIAEEYKIHFIVDIASGAFANTATKTSMMVFQKGAGPTEKVAFIGLDEKPLVTATLEDLRAKHYSLNYKQYLPQSAVEVEGFDMVKLGDILDKKSSGKTKVGDISNSGEYPFFSCKIDNPCGTHSSFDHIEPEYLLFAKSGGNAKQPTGDNLGIGRFYYMTEKSASTTDVSKFVLKNNRTSLKYVSLILKTKLHFIQSLARYTTGLGHIDVDQMLDVVEIPIPSLERQAQIVEAIDSWATLAQQEEVSLKILEKQMMFQVKEMGRGKERVKLETIAAFTFGYGIKSEDFGESGLPIIKTKNFKANGVSIISSNPRSNKKYDDKYLIKKGDLLMVVDGACGDSAMWLENENGWLNQHVAKLHIENETMRMYVAFVMKGDIFKEYIQSNVVITTIPHMQRDVAKNFEIPLPPLTEQQTLQSDFDEIRHKHAKIAEYKAKAQAAIQRLIPGAS